jgi:hypothetical protein
MVSVSFPFVQAFLITCLATACFRHAVPLNCIMQNKDIGVIAMN